MNPFQAEFLEKTRQLREDAEEGDAFDQFDTEIIVELLRKIEQIAGEE